MDVPIKGKKSVQHYPFAHTAKKHSRVTYAKEGRKQEEQGREVNQTHAWFATLRWGMGKGSIKMRKREEGKERRKLSINALTRTWL